MDINGLNTLLNRVKGILYKQDVSWQESRLRGEQFNLFHTCGVNHYEVTHSAILAELLSPDGTHGQKDAYLKLFLDVVKGAVDREDEKTNVLSLFDTSAAEVRTEYSISNGRIDILITDNVQRQAVIIENKIYAGDQYEQLKRYDTFAKETYGKGKYIILYLTLFGEDASEQSGEGVRYTNVSYDRDILEWINRCIARSVSMPLIRETLVQYANHIKKLTNQNMESKYKEELFKMMIANAEATDAICDALWECRESVFKKYVSEALSDFALEKGLKYKEYELFDNSGEHGFYFYKQEWENSAIWFFFETRSFVNSYWGISNYYGDKLKVEKRQMECMSERPTDYWPYGWEYLKPYENWDMSTITAMVNGKYADMIKRNVETILEEISRTELRLP